jgi:isoamyl acetate esterase
MIFFGANDATLPGNFQHVPLEIFRENLRNLVQHSAVVAQQPRIILLTPPPVNQYQLEAWDEATDTLQPSRTALHTKLYADTAREVGTSLNLPVADIWTAFMKVAGWKEGQPLPGSRDVPENAKLASLLTDGAHILADDCSYRSCSDNYWQDYI